MHPLQNKLRGCDVNLVGKCKQIHVLTDKLRSVLAYMTKGTTHEFFMSTKCTTGFTCKYLPLVNYNPQVQKCTITYELLMNIFNSSVITHE